MRIPTPVIAALTALALLAGCSSGGTESASTTASAEGPGARADAAGDAGFHGADISFLQEMVPHHAEAIGMARLVEERTDRAPLHELADEIITSQEAEVEQMEALLEEAGGTRHDTASEGHPGSEAVERLAGLQGAEFDLAFVDLMIEHHREAISSAEQVIDVGQHPQVRQLADGIIANQRTEIERMEAWRDLWAGEGG